MTRTIINLTAEQVKFLREFKETEKRSLREINRANILLLLIKGKEAAEIAEFLDIGRNTVSRTKQRFLREGMDSALEEEKRSGQPKIHTAAREAEVIALACSEAPTGRTRWTLELLTETLNRQKGFKKINRESVRLMLKKTNANHG
ncbi:MAG: helix-turn-helix domain-containing protein [Pyrinomonadaceae bacterium]